ncbi:hypothetical protein [Lutibacter sp.]|uniref:hypothetical protein n=1 Tax=Lutibacter sp. TaxID=1925666 RepID=UPI0027370617|nr:hypothetical protein [Lutibacter sp.]MDP3312014.1 hypothetical protein [Lutibacter sp.]
MKYKRLWYIFGVIFIAIIFVFYLLNESNFLNVIDEYDSVKVERTAKESCLQCHIGTTGDSEYHNPELIGCVSCHLGDGKSMDKVESHSNMVRIPGNLSDVKDTCGKCHSEELKKITNSLMTTNSGLIAVNKYIFGESKSPYEKYHIKDVKYSAADKHLRDMCANCHLGVEKTEYGAINQLSRGGGCNACHLNYSEDAKQDLQKYLSSNKKILPKFHPSTDIFVKNEHCFGCHSRSSRISTNYEGWQETTFKKKDIAQLKSSEYKVFEDQRVYKYNGEDVHHKKGMLCVDCHTSHEVMGDGKIHLRQDTAVKITCSDCHYKNKPNTLTYKDLDKESLLVFLHRNYSHTNKKILKVKKSGHPLVNTYIDSTGTAYLIGKKDKIPRVIKPQSQICSRDNVHKNVSCSMCHSSWTSKCIGCHNQFDKNEPRAFDLLDKKYGKGQWKEYVAEFSSMLPAMGVMENNGKKEIKPAIPGMILTIDKGSYAGKEIGEEVTFHRLFALNSPHTTTKKVRDCKSCHANSEALGFGAGNLTFDIKKGFGKWNFVPEYALNSNDNLPEDAWIPFLKNVKKDVINSTRTDFRPFTVKEQKQLLLVGACLQCHKETSKVMQESLINGIQPLLKKLNKSCILPTYK